MAGKERKGGGNCSFFESASFHPTCLPAISPPPPPPWRPFDPSFPPSSEKRNQRFRNREDNGACHSAILPFCLQRGFSYSSRMSCLPSCLLSYHIVACNLNLAPNISSPISCGGDGANQARRRGERAALWWRRHARIESANEQFMNDRDTESEGPYAYDVHKLPHFVGEQY